MKLIIAVIQPHRLENVKKELASVEVTRLTVTDVMGYGQQGGHTEVYRGTEFIKNLACPASHHSSARISQYQHLAQT